MGDWSIEKARQTYGIRHWGGGYFDINEAGHVAVKPRRAEGGGVLDMMSLTEEIHRAGLSLPVLVRFNDILRDRVDTLSGAFATAIDELGYRGDYTVVYPIKVNQQRSVVEELLHHGGRRVGLEAGSKPELMAVLALSDLDGGTIICNGYKDREYIRLALIGRKLGMRVHIVIEKLSELDLVLREAQQLGIEPLLGLRIRLSSIGAGNWQNSGGEKAKFGLSSAHILRVVERLQAAEMSHCLQMIHFHMGSQIANIHDIQKGVKECARFYAELRNLSVPVKVVDVGGGLGVDYEGSRSRSFCSMNYGVQEYAKNIVQGLWEVCEEQQLPHPDIISESGRALTAHHAVLITNVIDQEQHPGEAPPVQPEESDPVILHELWQAWRNLQDTEETERSLLETYHDAVRWLGEVQGMYQHGVLNLAQRARAEETYFCICNILQRRLLPGSRAHREVLDELNSKLADKYFCNFSLFQSLPDVWGIQQVFPIVPLQRLNQRPERRAVIEDITCDSDGRIDDYVDHDGLESSLAVHALKDGEPYLLGAFLVGAYQEILGDLHNLFGDTDSVNVELDQKGGYRLCEAQRGDTVDKVLRYVHYDPDALRQRLEKKIETVALAPQIKADFLQELAAGLEGYTYLEE